MNAFFEEKQCYLHILCLEFISSLLMAMVTYKTNDVYIRINIYGYMCMYKTVGFFFLATKQASIKLDARSLYGAC